MGSGEQQEEEEDEEDANAGGDWPLMMGDEKADDDASEGQVAAVAGDLTTLGHEACAGNAIECPPDEEAGW